MKDAEKRARTDLHDAHEQTPEIPLLKIQHPEPAQQQGEGLDELPAELLKTHNQIIAEVLCKVCNIIVEMGEWPTAWRWSVFIAIL